MQASKDGSAMSTIPIGQSVGRAGSISALGMEGTHGDNEVLVIQSPITTKQAADSTTLLVLEAQRGRSADFDAGWIMGA